MRTNIQKEELAEVDECLAEVERFMKRARAYKRRMQQSKDSAWYCGPLKERAAV